MTRLSKATGTFDALNEVSPSIQSRDGDISVVNTSSFVGTITIYRSVAGADVAVDTLTNSNMPYDRVIESAVASEFYLKVTAYTSGSCTYYLAGA